MLENIKEATIKNGHIWIINSGMWSGMCTV